MIKHWTCPQCNYVNAAHIRFCSRCGAVNPALAAPIGGYDRTGPTSAWGHHPLLWVLMIGLGLIGCALIAVGGGLWWRWQNRETVTLAASTVAADAGTATAPPTAADTPTLTPTATPEPVVTATATPIKTETLESSTGDSLAVTADTPVPPTSSSEGIILFLSSRDHDPQTEAEQKELAQYRELELYAMKPDGSGQIRLSNGNPRWDNSIASLTTYYKPNQVVIGGKYVVDLTTGQVIEELKLEFPNTESTTPFRAQFPVWSSEGEIFFFGNEGQASSSLYYLDTIQGVPQKLTFPPDNVWGDGWPALSPNGQWLVFLRNWSDEAEDGLWLIKPDGSEAHRILASSANISRRAFWSPDGRQLAYEGPKPNADTFNFELWVAKADGSNPRQLTSFGNDKGALEPKWSPDGQRIVFQSDFDLGHIFVIDSAGGEPKQLTTVGDANLAPLWLPLSPDDIRASPDPIAAPPTPSPQPATPTSPPVAVAPQPTSTLPPNCPNLGVQITSPRPGTVFTERYNHIIGTANINRFHHWRLEYSTNPGGGWSFLFERDYPVENNELMMFDASTVPAGPYGLRLTVVDESGNYPAPCEVWYTNSY